ncbi:hypothetical protein MXB_4818, partial [Myxobolus squamalis]
TQTDNSVTQKGIKEILFNRNIEVSQPTISAAFKNIGITRKKLVEKICSISTNLGLISKHRRATDTAPLIPFQQLLYRQLEGKIFRLPSYFLKRVDIIKKDHDLTTQTLSIIMSQM